MQTAQRSRSPPSSLPLFVCFVYNLIFFIYILCISVRPGRQPVAAPCITSYWLLASRLSDAIRRNLSYRLCQAAQLQFDTRAPQFKSSVSMSHDAGNKSATATATASQLPLPPGPSPVNWTLSLSCVLVI